MLEDMDLGHKVAAMPGQKRMTYDADALGPVADVQCIASGLGAASAYGLLREVSARALLEHRLTLASVLNAAPLRCAAADGPRRGHRASELALGKQGKSTLVAAFGCDIRFRAVCVNLLFLLDAQAEKDFMIYDDVEKLYKRHSKVLDIACVVEKDLNGACVAATRGLRARVYGSWINEAELRSQHRCSLLFFYILNVAACARAWAFVERCLQRSHAGIVF